MCALNKEKKKGNNNQMKKYAYQIKIDNIEKVLTIKLSQKNPVTYNKLRMRISRNKKKQRNIQRGSNKDSRND